MRLIFRNIKFLIIAPLLLPGLSSLGDVQVSSAISKFQLNSCNHKTNKCLSVEADQAESGSMTPNMILKNVSVKIKNNKTKRETIYTKSIGFYDIENQRILISELTPNKTLKETVFLINDVSVQNMEMK